MTLGEVRIFVAELFLGDQLNSADVQSRGKNRRAVF